MGETKMAATGDFLYLRTPEECTGVRKIVFEEGRGAANIQDSGMPRNFDFVLKHIINPLISMGYINDGKNRGFDDRKCRYDSSRLDGTKLVIAAGPTWYQAVMEDFKRRREEISTLIKKGQDLFDDPYAYFSRSMGVCVVPITQEGHTFIGKRKGKLCSGYLNFIAGNMSFNENVSLLSAESDASQELGEYGIGAGCVEGFRLVGIAAHPLFSDMDITFLANVSLSDEYFLSGEWKRNVVGRQEHEDQLFCISGRGEVAQLLRLGRLPNGEKVNGLMYSSRLGLEALMREMRDD